MEPAKITIPSHIKFVAVVDRSLPPNPVEKMVTGVIVGEDVNRNQSEAQQAISGLIHTINESSRLEATMSGLRLEGAQLGGTLPGPLPADTIAKICKEYNTDGVIALESFAYNTAVHTAQKAVNIVETGIKYGVVKAIGKTIETAATVNDEVPSTVMVKVGFRFYDGTKETICDQLTYTHTYNREVNNYFNYKHTANETSYFTGKLYAKRIVPSYIWVNRSYYKRPKNSVMKMAARMATVGDWQGASDLWHKIEKESNRKKAGRASYNLALCYEVFGDLDQALFWCKKAKDTYKNNLAEEYLKLLEQRRLERNLIEEQMK